jgi:hypothetical protein
MHGLAPSTENEWRLNEDGSFSMFVWVAAMTEYEPPDPTHEEVRMHVAALTDRRIVLWNGDGSLVKLLSPLQVPRSTRMADAKTELSNILREAIAWLLRPGNDFAWSWWNNASEAVAELSGHVAALEAGTLPPKLDLTVVFAPTGPIQEVGVSSGWGEAFLELSGRFDRAVGGAYP